MTIEPTARLALGSGSRSTQVASHLAGMTMWWNVRSIEKQPAVYILASRRNGTLYVGVTSHFVSRSSEHKQDLMDGFTKTYGVHLLVYIEFHDTMDEAIKREKQIKRWRRAWKIELIETGNADWRDLYSELSGLTDPNVKLRNEDSSP